MDKLLLCVQILFGKHHPVRPALVYYCQSFFVQLTRTIIYKLQIYTCILTYPQVSLDLLYLNPGYNKLKKRNENLANAGGNWTLTLIYIGQSSSFWGKITINNMFQIHVLYGEGRNLISVALMFCRMLFLSLLP